MTVLIKGWGGGGGGRFSGLERSEECILPRNKKKGRPSGPYSELWPWLQLQSWRSAALVKSEAVLSSFWIVFSFHTFNFFFNLPRGGSCANLRTFFFTRTRLCSLFHERIYALKWIYTTHSFMDFQTSGGKCNVIVKLTCFFNTLALSTKHK